MAAVKVGRLLRGSTPVIDVYDTGRVAIVDPDAELNVKTNNDLSNMIRSLIKRSEGASVPPAVYAMLDMTLDLASAIMPYKAELLVPSDYGMKSDVLI